MTLFALLVFRLFSIRFLTGFVSKVSFSRALSDFRGRSFLWVLFLLHSSLLSFCDGMHFREARLSRMLDKVDCCCDRRRIAGIDARVVEIKFPSGALDLMKKTFDCNGR